MRVGGSAEHRCSIWQRATDKQELYQTADLLGGVFGAPLGVGGLAARTVRLLLRLALDAEEQLPHSVRQVLRLWEREKEAGGMQ